jgi:hypothetical protein
MGVEAGRALSDELPPPTDEDLLILGVAHMGCLEKAFRLLRSQRAPLKTNLPIMTLEVMEKRSGPAVDLPALKGECPFCQSFNSLLTKEDIYPTWLLKELRRYGARSKHEGRWSTKIVGYTTPSPVGDFVKIFTSIAAAYPCPLDTSSTPMSRSGLSL